jgi:NADH-quinone oxidoreductase subunit N
MMAFVTPFFSIALPEIFLLLMANVILLMDVFVAKKYPWVTYVLVQFTLVAAIVLTLPQYNAYPIPAFVFGGSYIVDRLAVLSKLFIYVLGLFAFVYARGYITEKKIAQGDYYLLGLFSILGMSVTVSAYSFLTLFLGLELLSLPLYALVAMHKESTAAAEAAMKYFVTGALASGMLLYGISLLYGITGSIELMHMAELLQSHQDTTTLVALIFVLSALIFKLGAVPFHMWVPDVYEGAASPVTLFIASAPKIAAFALVVRVLAEAMPSLQVSWEQILIVVAIVSMFVGNVLAIAQTNLKRMLGYSSISHIGYTLLGIIAGPNSTNGYSAAMFYIATYVFIVAGAFAIITVLSHRGIEFDRLEDYRGLNARSPWLAFMMLLFMFSMAGVPPTVGFIAKLGLLEALVEAHLAWLAVLALVFALIGAYYYLRVVMYMYFEEPTETEAAIKISMTPEMLVAISINGSAALLLGLLPSFLIDLCRISLS